MPFLLLGVLLVTSCGGGGGSIGGGPAGAPLAAPAATTTPLITIPSAGETVLGEKRDFYVTGIFAPSVKRPGDIRIDLVRFDHSVFPVPTIVRTVQSHVDATGMTSLSAIRTDYPNGRNVGGMNPLLVPDLVQEPGASSLATRWS